MVFCAARGLHQHIRQRFDEFRYVVTLVRSRVDFGILVCDLLGVRNHHRGRLTFGISVCCGDNGASDQAVAFARHGWRDSDLRLISRPVNTDRKTLAMIDPSLTIHTSTDLNEGSHPLRPTLRARSSAA